MEGSASAIGSTSFHCLTACSCSSAFQSINFVEQVSTLWNKKKRLEFSAIGSSSVLSKEKQVITSSDENLPEGVGFSFTFVLQQIETLGKDQFKICDWEQRHSSEIWSFCCSSQVYTLGAPMCKELILDPCTTYRYPLHWVQTCIRWPHHVPSTPSPCYSLLEGPHTKLADFDSFLGVNVKRRKLSFFARCQAFHVLI